jgi:DNA adenine methylase
MIFSGVKSPLTYTGTPTSQIYKGAYTPSQRLKPFAVCMHLLLCGSLQIYKKINNMTQLKTPITYYGGKQLMAKHILPLIPVHDSYIEPFCGGAAIFWLKEPSKLEILNDTNKELINFYDVLKNDFVSLEKEISISLHSRNLHRDAFTVYNNPHLFTSLKRAWAVWVLSAQGFGGQLSSTWGRDTRGNKTVKAIASKRESFSLDYAVRLQNVSLESRDAIKVILSCDYLDAFFYVDPPYYNADMGHYDGYTIDDFERLLQTLSKIEGKFLLSSYPSDILDKYIKLFKWHSYGIEMPVHCSNKGKRKIEVLTANYEIKKAD